MKGVKTFDTSPYDVTLFTIHVFRQLMHDDATLPRFFFFYSKQLKQFKSLEEFVLFLNLVLRYLIQRQNKSLAKVCLSRAVIQIQTTVTTTPLVVTHLMNLLHRQQAIYSYPC